MQIIDLFLLTPAQLRRNSCFTVSCRARERLLRAVFGADGGKSGLLISKSGLLISFSRARTLSIRGEEIEKENSEIDERRSAEVRCLRRFGANGRVHGGGARVILPCGGFKCVLEFTHFLMVGTQLTLKKRG